MDGQIAVLAVAEKGSFEAAGKYLGIGKSGVRKRVTNVERELGTPAFRAIGNRMEPTEAGNLYLPTARASVRQAMLGVDRVRAFVRVQSQVSPCTQMPENALSGPDTALNSRNLPNCLYSNPGQKAMHAKRIASSLYLYPGQTLAGTSSGFYVQQSGISVQ